jgi:hypothetical protein
MRACGRGEPQRRFAERNRRIARNELPPSGKEFTVYIATAPKATLRNKQHKIYL